MMNNTRFARTTILSLLTAGMVLGGCDSDDSSTPTDVDDLPHFSFFVTSQKALEELSGSPDGFGGDLSYGETGPGAYRPSQ